MKEFYYTLRKKKKKKKTICSTITVEVKNTNIAVFVGI